MPKGLKWLGFAFTLPFVVATTMQLMPDININHKFIVIGSILLNILTAFFLFSLFKSKNLATKIFAYLLSAVIMVTGFVDIITLHNLDNHHITVKTDNELLKWTLKNTNTDDVFLTDHYSLHPILLAGRKLFSGWAYYAWSAGYDTDARERIKQRIYSAENPDILKRLVETNSIDYIVVDDGNRTSDSYILNEHIIEQTFEIVYEFPEYNLIIYKTNID